ncbi:MAG: hypothetical protein V1663_00065 [archaeon]
MKQLMKKGQYEGFEIVFSIILLVVLLYVASFMFLANKDKLTDDRLNQIAFSESNLLLLNYLRTPLIYDNQEIVMSDLIVLKDKNRIKEESREIFNKYCSGKCAWRITIDYGAAEQIIVEKDLLHNFVTNHNNNFNLTGFNQNISINMEIGYDQKISGYSRFGGGSSGGGGAENNIK